MNTDANSYGKFKIQGNINNYVDGLLDNKGNKLILDENMIYIFGNKIPTRMPENYYYIYEDLEDIAKIQLVLSFRNKKWFLFIQEVKNNLIINLENRKVFTEISCLSPNKGKKQINWEDSLELVKGNQFRLSNNFKAKIYTFRTVLKFNGIVYSKKALNQI